MRKACFPGPGPEVIKKPEQYGREVIKKITVNIVAKIMILMIKLMNTHLIQI